MEIVTYVLKILIEMVRRKDVLIGISETSGKYKKDKIVELLESRLFAGDPSVRVVLKAGYKKILRTGELEH